MGRPDRGCARRWLFRVLGGGGIGILLFLVFGGREKIRELRISMEKRELLPRLNRIFPGGDDQAGSNEEAMRNQISRSSVIAFTQERRRDGGTGDVIVEIFKLVNDVECFYEVGDVLGEVEQGGLADLSQRRIHFLHGNPATPGASMSIHAGLILKQRDLRESTVRKWIAEIVAEERSVDSIMVRKFNTMYPSPSFGELLEHADFIVFSENKIENGMVQEYAKEVFQMNRDVEVTVKPGDRIDDGYEVQENYQYGEGTLKFYGGFDNWKDLGYMIHRGGLILHGDMPIGIALGRIRDLCEARLGSNLEDSEND